MSAASSMTGWARDRARQPDGGAVSHAVRGSAGSPVQDMIKENPAVMNALTMAWPAPLARQATEAVGSEAECGICTSTLENMRFPYELPPLPYGPDALRPLISGNTIRFHHREHHQRYIDGLNRAVGDTEFETMPLRALIRATAGKPETAVMFNNAAQAWNHAFYWDSLTPQGGGLPPPALRKMIDASFGSVDACLRQLAHAAIAQFGTGWVWLARDDKKIRVVRTCGADNPLTRELTPLLAIDLWEHAYYLDYQNRLEDHVSGVIGRLVNWDFAAKNLA